jgi:large subunit ribosomal protein L10e
MAKVRKGVAYRIVERPYTRKSKYRNKNFVRSVPANHIVAFDNGNLRKQFPYRLKVVARGTVQIRDRALESARQSSNRLLEKVLGKAGYHMKVNVYPHQILRENPLASGAGADRMSTGMAAAFGKSIGIAARVFEGDTIFQISVEKQNLDTAKIAAKRISHKLPCKTEFVIEQVAVSA